MLDYGPIHGVQDIDAAFSALHGRGANAVLVMHRGLTFEHRAHVVSAVARLRLPAMYGSREAVELGGLMSYAVSIADVFRRSAFFVDRLLQGARPADLPVEQPTSFQLVVNLRTARALGLSLPRALLVRAERVIE